MPPPPPIFAVLLLLVVPSAADPSDKACLSSLHQSLSDPAGNLRNWSAATFSAPCNGFTSYLFGATCNNGRIYKLSLANRQLEGSISPFVSNCTNLQSLDLSSNSISGPIPAEISALLNLAVLNLSGNHLSGEIPPQLALCAYLNVIDLHGNELSGPIPPQLGLLARLSAFDVSDNRLEGMIPAMLANRSALEARFNATSFARNRGLYGFPLPPARGSGLSVVSIVGIGIGSGMVSLVISFTAVCVWLRVTEQRAAAKAANGDDGKISHLMPEY